MALNEQEQIWQAIAKANNILITFKKELELPLIIIIYVLYKILELSLKIVFFIYTNFILNIIFIIIKINITLKMIISDCIICINS